MFHYCSEVGNLNLKKTAAAYSGKTKTIFLAILEAKILFNSLGFGLIFQIIKFSNCVCLRDDAGADSLVTGVDLTGQVEQCTRYQPSHAHYTHSETIHVIEPDQPGRAVYKPPAKPRPLYTL
jgi:hypothetical protein